MATSPDVLLVHPPYHRRVGSGKMPPIGLAYVAAACESEGMSVLIVDCALENESQMSKGLEELRTWLADRLREVEVRKCIGIGPCTTPALKSLKVVAEVLTARYPYTPIVYGGPFASIPGQEPVFFDILGGTALVRGDGEHVFPELVRMIQRGDIGKAKSGVVWHGHFPTEAGLVTDLDEVRFPARHLLDNKRYRPSLRRDVFKGGSITAIYSSRGCPYQCLFCLSPLLRNRRMVRRSYANVYEEMRQCIDSYDLAGFIFYDDCMFIKSRDIDSRVSAFTQGLMREVAPTTWEMELRCDAVAALAPATLRALVASGCAGINMGIEKGDDRSLAALGKETTVDEIVTACRKVDDIAPEIRLTGTFILGGVNEGIADVDATIEFATHLSLDFAHFYPMEIYPGTELFAYAYAGRPPTAWAYEVLSDDSNVWGELILENRSLPVSRLLELTKRAYRAFYNRSEWHDRYARRIAPTLQYDGLAIVDRWCSDRFMLGGNTG